MFEPATGDRLYRVGRAIPDDIARAAAAASAARAEWAATAPRTKAAIFHRAAGWLEDREQALLRLVVRETGSVPPKAAIELREATAMLHLAGGVALEPTGLVLPSISPSLGRARGIGERLRAGLLHINDQTVNDEVVNPFAGRGCSGNGAALGAPAWWDQFTEWQWVTMRDAPPRYPF